MYVSASILTIMEVNRRDMFEKLQEFDFEVAVVSVICNCLLLLVFILKKKAIHNSSQTDSHLGAPQSCSMHLCHHCLFICGRLGYNGSSYFIYKGEIKMNECLLLIIFFRNVGLPLACMAQD